ncbi:MAG: hypothetical protein AAFN93_13855 [Bacteroidota bacterium]
MINNPDLVDKTQDHNAIYLLRDILLEEDRNDREELRRKIEGLNLLLNNSERLKEKMDPIMQGQLVYLKEHFPELFGDSVTDSIRFQIENSQNEMIEALYPVIGKLIRRYITREIEVLTERIDRKLSRAFSWNGWMRRVKARFSGAKHGELIIKSAMEAELKQIFVVEQHSGMLLGSFDRENNVDQDMVAGMLTAIKAFVTDAISNDAEDLESIEYNEHKILIRNFRSFYIAVVTEGVIDASFKQRLDGLVLDFYEKILKNLKIDDDNVGMSVSKELEAYFGY